MALTGLEADMFSFMKRGCGGDVIINILLWILGW